MCREKKMDIFKFLASVAILSNIKLSADKNIGVQKKYFHFP